MKNEMYLSMYFILLVVIIFIQAIQMRKLNNKIKDYERIKKKTYVIGDKISGMQTKQEVYDFILNTAMDLIDKGSSGSIIIREEDGLFHFKALRGIKDSIKNQKIKKEDLQLYQYNGCKDIAILKSNFKNSLQGQLEIKSELAAPIHYDGKLIGVIIINSIDNSLIFNEEDIKTMRYISYEFELAIKNFLIQEKLKYIATHDELTGLFNRRCFNDILEEELKVIQYRNCQSILAILDLDNFKSINDNYGHYEGDKALIRLAKAMKTILQDTDIYARMSGDEFVIIFRNSTYKEAEKKLQKIRRYLAEGNDLIYVDFTYGLAEISNKIPVKRDDVFSLADKRMYEYKKKKKLEGKKAVT